MNIIVKKDSLVKDIQQQFAALYPFLKIEFIKKPLTEKRSVKGMYALPEELFLNLSSAKNPGSITVADSLTVSEMEMEFKTQFGVNMQVYRKSGNVWIETTLTDKWTLQKQNQEGEQMSKPRNAGSSASSLMNLLKEDNPPGPETE